MKRLESYRRYTTLDHALTWANANQLAPRDMSQLKRSFAPAGQSTQMIIGATGESDYTLLQTTQALYQGFDLKRVFLFSIHSFERRQCIAGDRNTTSAFA